MQKIFRPKTPSNHDKSLQKPVKKREKSWIRKDIRRVVERYMTDNDLSFDEAVNQMILDAHYAAKNPLNTFDFDTLPTRQDFNDLERKVNLFHAVMELGLLELIEGSVCVKVVSEKVPNIKEIVRSERNKFELFFKQIKGI